MKYGKSKFQRPDDIADHKKALAKTLSQLAAIQDAIIDNSTEDIPDLWVIKPPHTFPEIEKIVNKAIVRLGQFSNYLTRIKP